MEKVIPKETRVQQDKFWTWKVNREENLAINEFSNTQERLKNYERLNLSVAKAKLIAERIKHRRQENHATT